jgi:hypothetical protein
MNAQILGNEQQTELANLQFEFQTNAANMSAENQHGLLRCKLPQTLWLRMLASSNRWS